MDKAQPVVRKAKKKPVKDEMDRQKQAEKKKRRLEKALATSAAIISELEKKKQKKKEEQQRLDEEGAAIAEAVALHVLIGEDADDPCKIVLNQNDGFGPWDSSMCSIEGFKWVSNGYGSEISEWRFSSQSDLHYPYLDEAGWETTGFSAGLIAAQAVSALQIAEDAREDTILLNGMLRR